MHNIFTAFVTTVRLYVVDGIKAAATALLPKAISGDSA